MGIGDHQLDAAPAAARKLAQEAGPGRVGLQDLAPAVAVDADRTGPLELSAPFNRPTGMFRTPRGWEPALVSPTRSQKCRDRFAIDPPLLPLVAYENILAGFWQAGVNR
jgi:hypothetical protein